MKSSAAISALLVFALQAGQSLAGTIMDERHDLTTAQKIKLKGISGIDHKIGDRQLSSSSPGNETCSNGVLGIEGSGQCCVLECGQCGGVGCADAGLAAGLTAEDCCAQRIKFSDIYCQDTSTAPCIIDSGYPECEGVITWRGDGWCDDAENNNEECGYDGGDCCSCTCDPDAEFGCGENAPYVCRDTSVECFGPTPAPTPAPTMPLTCSNGISGVEALNACCVAACGTCGGQGCSDRAEERDLTAADCCIGRIRSAGVSCDDSGESPCLL